MISDSGSPLIRARRLFRSKREVKDEYVCVCINALTWQMHSQMHALKPYVPVVS
jgi:hypothetical protein